MEDAYITNFCAEMFCVGRKFQDGVRCRMVKRVIEELLVAVYDRVEDIRHSKYKMKTKFSYKGIKKLISDLKLVYAAPTEETALDELQLFCDKWDTKYPKIHKSWHDNWATLSTH